MFNLTFFFRVNPGDHPSISIVRTICHLFIVFIISWNIRHACYIFSLTPDFSDPEGPEYCHEATFYLAFTCVIMYNIVSGTLIVFWLTALIAGTNYLCL